MPDTAPQPSRRAFLVGVASTFALVVAGCARGGDPVASPPTTAVDPAAAPSIPELSAMEPQFVEEARAYLVGVPGAVLPRARALLPPQMHDGLEAGLLALSDVCPSDQVQLRFCESSRWFDCPACGSMFDILGAYRAGPAPRGMTMYRVSIRGEKRDVSVERHPEFEGLANGTRLIAQEPSGPLCV